MSQHTQGPWTNGWGSGLTGPNTPSIPTVKMSIAVHDRKGTKGEAYPKAQDYFIPISVGTDTIAIVVGPNREHDAKLIAAAPDLLRRLKSVKNYISRSDEWLYNEVDNLIKKVEG